MWDPAQRPDAEGRAATFAPPCRVHRILALSGLAASAFGADEETVQVHPAITRHASGKKGFSCRRLSAALAAVAVLALVGVAAIACGAGVGNPAARVPAVVAHPRATTAPGSGPTFAPSAQQAS